MSRPCSPPPEVMEIVTALFEKMLLAGPRSKDLSSIYLTLPKDIQLETERQSRNVAKRAASLIAEEILRSYGPPQDWDRIPQARFEAIIRECMARARRELREAGRGGPEETGGTG